MLMLEKIAHFPNEIVVCCLDISSPKRNDVPQNMPLNIQANQIAAAVIDSI